MLRILGVALLLGSALAFGAVPAQALQVAVASIDKNSDGTMTYHFAVKVEEGDVVTPGADFFTVYNFAGMVVASAKAPPGWAFSSEDFGRVPTWGGYPAVMPVDVPGLSNLTWTATKPVTAAAEIEGFTATTRVVTTTEGEYTAQITREQSAVDGAGARPTKQALIGQLPTPSYINR